MIQKQNSQTTQSKSLSNPQDILKRVMSLIATHLEKEEQNVDAGQTFADLGCDEFDMIELVMKWEDEFGIIIEDSEVPLLADVQSVVSCIQSKK